MTTYDPWRHDKNGCNGNIHEPYTFPAFECANAHLCSDARRAATRFTHVTCQKCVTNASETRTCTTRQKLVVALCLRCGQRSAKRGGDTQSVRRNYKWAMCLSPLRRTTILRWHVMQGRICARTGCCMDDLHVARGRLARRSSQFQGYRSSRAFRVVARRQAAADPLPRLSVPAHFVAP